MKQPGKRVLTKQAKQLRDRLKGRFFDALEAHPLDPDHMMKVYRAWMRADERYERRKKPAYKRQRAVWR